MSDLFNEMVQFLQTIDPELLPDDLEEVTNWPSPFPRLDLVSTNPLQLLAFCGSCYLEPESRLQMLILPRWFMYHSLKHVEATIDYN